MRRALSRWSSTSRRPPLVSRFSFRKRPNPALAFLCRCTYGTTNANSPFLKTRSSCANDTISNMKSRTLLALGLGSLSLMSALAPLVWAQTEPAATTTETPAIKNDKIIVLKPSSKSIVGADVPNDANLFEPVKATRPLKVALYEGPGSGDSGVEAVSSRVAMIPGSVVTRLKPEEIGTTDLTPFDFVVFSGGSGSAQAKAIGDKGLQNVRTYVKNGGGYLGICAGAYLACSNYPWSLGILNAKTVQPWLRGSAALQLELTEEGRTTFGDVKKPFFVRYHNGPVIQPDNKPDLPPYKVEAWFRTEAVREGNKQGLMVDTPAVVSGIYGKGRVLTISPHPEDSRGLENFVPHAMVWLSDKTPVAK
ncbi:biofilm PGA synthesis protein PgaB [bacterium]|nr:MAG: biofilm PGA synthesis protein PgaB [bacterium]